jgi:hypothetical protein
MKVSVGSDVVFIIDTSAVSVASAGLTRLLCHRFTSTDNARDMAAHSSSHSRRESVRSDHARTPSQRPTYRYAFMSTCEDTTFVLTSASWRGSAVSAKKRFPRRSQPAPTTVMDETSVLTPRPAGC